MPPSKDAVSLGGRLDRLAFSLVLAQGMVRHDEPYWDVAAWSACGPSGGGVSDSFPEDEVATLQAVPVFAASAISRLLVDGLF